MAAELRWILAALSALLLAGIWWWGARRSRQARGNAELRESTMAPPAEPESPDFSRLHAGTRDWGVPPFEPLSIHTADFDPVHMLDLPMTAHVDSLDETVDLGFVGHEVEASKPEALPTKSGAVPVDPGTVPAEPGAVRAGPESAVPGSPSERQDASVSEKQRIVTVRVCAAGQSRWAGSDLLAVLEDHGLAYGRYQVFHRKHVDGRTLFCAASLIEPGTFDMTQMPHEEYRGLTLFAVLPGPADPLQTVDALIETAEQLAEALSGTVQDSKGMPFSLQRAAALREEVARSC